MLCPLLGQLNIVLNSVLKLLLCLLATLMQVHKSSTMSTLFQYKKIEHGLIFSIKTKRYSVPNSVYWQADFW